MIGVVEVYPIFAFYSSQYIMSISSRKQNILISLLLDYFDLFHLLFKFFDLFDFSFLSQFREIQVELSFPVLKFGDEHLIQSIFAVLQVHEISRTF